MGFDILLSATGICQLESHMSPLPEVRELTPLGGGGQKPASQVPEEGWLLSKTEILL